MSNKKFAAQDLEDTHGPMNSVAKQDAKVWASKKNRSNDFSQEQLHRIEVAKLQKEKRASKKIDRRTSKQLLRNIGD
jgi:hypothetical protein